MHSIPNLPLSYGESATSADQPPVEIPQLGFGVWQIPDEQAPASVKTALEVGYRSIDTARIYGNEVGVGRALAQTEVSRDEIFLTTKVWNDDQGRDSTLRAFEASVKRLGTDVDLYLIHWPAPEQDQYVDTWRALVQLRAEGRIGAAGVCNFEQAHLQRLIDETGETPSINQIELHPYKQRSALRAFHAQIGIVTEAWSPLAQGGDVLTDPTIIEIAAKHSRTPAQVILRWHIQLGNVVIPKSATPSRIAENFDIFGFELDSQDMTAIEALDTEG